MSEKKESAASVLIGAAFLMATSAIGPGFLTQTTVFTDQLKAAFAFAIVVSIIIDIIVQLNIWRILGVSGKRAQDVANEVFPGLGYFIAILVAIGGLIFNIGNVGGAAMGLNVICGLPLAPAAIISALCAIVLFVSKEAGKAMDMFTKVLGIIMLAMVGFMVVKTQPPVGLALKETVIPSQIDWLTILTLVGGTVGGYITFSGAHRIIDANITGVDNLGKISHGSTRRWPGRQRRRRGPRPQQPAGVGLPHRSRRARLQNIRRNPLVRRRHIRRRSFVHLDIVPAHALRARRSEAPLLDNRLHLHLDGYLHDDGESRHAAHLRGLRQRIDTPDIARRDSARRA